MSNIVKLINQSEAMTIKKKINSEVIKQAEKELNFKFDDEYKMFLKNFGILSLGTNEIFGLGVEGYMNVIEATLEEREFYGESLEKYIVIQNCGIGNILITLDESGVVYEHRNDENKKIYDSFSEFLKKEIL